MEIKDLEKPARLTVTIENGKLLHAFLLQCINYNVDIDKQFNNWIKNFLNHTDRIKHDSRFIC